MLRPSICNDDALTSGTRCVPEGVRHRRPGRRRLLKLQESAPEASAWDATRPQRAALIFVATSAGTHFVQSSGCVFRKCLAASVPVAWFSVIHSISLPIASVLQ